MTLILLVEDYPGDYSRLAIPPTWRNLPLNDSPIVEYVKSGAILLLKALGNVDPPTIH